MLVERGYVRIFHLPCHPDADAGSRVIGAIEQCLGVRVCASSGGRAVTQTVTRTVICRCEFERTTALTGGVGGAAEVGSFSTGSILTRRPAAVRRDAVGTHMFGGQRGCRRSRKGACPRTFSLRRPRLPNPEPHRSWQGEPSAPARLPFVASFRTWRIDSASGADECGSVAEVGDV